MKYTREQYEEISEGWDAPLQDVLFEANLKADCYELFNNLPNHIQSIAVAWGMSDTVFRDNAYEYIIKKEWGMTCEEYYSSDISTPKDCDFSKWRSKELTNEKKTIMTMSGECGINYPNSTNLVLEKLVDKLK